MKAIKPTQWLLVFSLLAVSCGTTEELAYVSDAERDSARTVLTSYVSTIHPGDQLYIHVDSKTPESVIPFNEETNKKAPSRRSASQANMPETDNIVDGYLVDQQGKILFPILGPLMVADITKDSLSNLIARRLREGGYVMDPSVTVSLMNFRVSVLGEVTVPRELHVTGDRLTIFEALAMCGDLTLYGKRENVKVIRQSNLVGSVDASMSSAHMASSFMVGEINLTSKELFDSPYYYLQQGDIVYVEPNDRKKEVSYRDPETMKYVTTAVSAATLAMHIYRIITSPALR